ncbi:hypothetical protein QR98_0082420 [Sarcoptes scabiei]|uniref:Uncharacterized protein n=1 Tax=Sarcoptes scabiei TaxID=52283 RepID=A0A132AFC8_SARSC|nr:hypothetical protein QR98_0082420 [Sarcoptes scabiei]
MFLFFPLNKCYGTSCLRSFRLSIVDCSLFLIQQKLIGHSLNLQNNSFFFVPFITFKSLKYRPNQLSRTARFISEC